MIKFKKYEKYGVRICNKINCNSDNPHFHVSVPNGGGTALTIMGDEENIVYYLTHAHIMGYPKFSVGKS